LIDEISYHILAEVQSGENLRVVGVTRRAATQCGDEATSARQCIRMGRKFRLGPERQFLTVGLAGGSEVILCQIATSLTHLR
jgi:hypothetical protein